jgi:hypothetical protein
MSLKDSLNSALAKARKFQIDLLNSFPRRKEALLQLVEALAGAVKPSSVVELSLAPSFQRTYSNIQKAIDALNTDIESDKSEFLNSLSEEPIDSSTAATASRAKETDAFLSQTRIWTDTFADLVPQETIRPFKLFAIDATSTGRPYAQTLEDRTYLHQSSQLGSSITIGLQASMLVAIPEEVEGEAKWTLPLSVERIPSKKTPCEVAKQQLEEIARLWRNSLSVIVADSGYTALKPCGQNQIIIARGRIDRTGRRPYREDKNKPGQRGRPRKYEEKMLYFADNVPKGNEGGPDEEFEYEAKIKRREVCILLSRWKGIQVHGQTNLVDIVKCEIFLKTDSFKKLFDQPLLLIVSGERRGELSSLQVYESYLRRFDIEHFFRFEKQQLLFSGYQTAELQRQVNWWWLCLMAYWLLFLVRAVAPESNRPWMPKRRSNMTASPGEVKRVFGMGIFPNLGSPTKKPLPRGKSKGRVQGTILKKRERKKPIKKRKKPPNGLAA